MLFRSRSLLQNDMFNDGDWRLSGSFAPALLDQGIASIQRQLKLWYDKGVTPVEVSARKSNVIGAFKVALTTTDGMAGALLAAVSRGYGVSWLDELPAKVDALTTEQVNAAVKKYLKPETMVLVKAGTFGAAAAPAK